MTSERMFPSGGWIISALLNGYYVKRRYFGYTKREAQQEFRAEFTQKGQVIP